MANKASRAKATRRMLARKGARVPVGKAAFKGKGGFPVNIRFGARLKKAIQPKRRKTPIKPKRTK